MRAPSPSVFTRAGLSKGAWVGAAVLALFVLLALFGPWLAPHSPTHGVLESRLQPPSAAHWLGTDAAGVDLLSAMLYGARVALLIAGITVLASFLIGLTLGTIAGYFGGLVDEIIMRVVDVLLAFPGILLNLAIVAVVHRPGIGIVILALVANGWVGYARIARGQVLSLKERDFVQAARCVGASHGRIMRRYVVPNILSPLIVKMSFSVGGVILVEATLSFLGLGPQLSYSWGALLSQGTDYLWVTHRLATTPGVAIAVVVLACNLLGDGLRDRLDPRSRGLV